MPGSKKAKTPADDTRSSAGASAVDRLDLSDALAVGTPELTPLPITYRGIDLDLCRYYTADQVEALVDNVDGMRRLSRELAEDNDSEESEEVDVAKLQTQVGEYIDTIIAMLFPDQEEQAAALVEKLNERSDGEIARIFRMIYARAGIVNQMGEFLAL